MLIQARKRTRVVVIGLAMLAGLCLGVHAGSMEPPGPPGPTMKTLHQAEPRTPIHESDLPLLISSPGSYYLAEDMSTTGDGISIQASNVTIDLMGFTLSGGAPNGILSYAGADYIVVKNGKVSGWSFDGLSLFNSVHSRVINVLAEGNGEKGIEVGDDSVVMDSTARGNGNFGIWAGQRSMIRGCVAILNGIGIRVGDGSSVEGCLASDNTQAGISLNSGCTVTGCTSSLNGTYGISVSGDGNHVVGNTCHSDVFGIRVWPAGSGNRVESNHVTDSSFKGIEVNSADNVIIRNTARNNGAGPSDNFVIAAGNFVGTIVTTDAAMNAATNDLVNIQF